MAKKKRTAWALINKEGRIVEQTSFIPFKEKRKYDGLLVICDSKTRLKQYQSKGEKIAKIEIKIL